MQIAHISHVVLSYALEKRKKERKKNKFKISCSLFLTVRRINETLGVYFTLQYLRIFIYKSFASFWCVYVEAAPIP